MTYQDLQKYLVIFEKQVLIKGIEQKIFLKTNPISRKPGKLANTKFGRIIGTSFLHSTPAVIDYYGLQKKSSGLLTLFAQHPDRHVMEARIVYFASIKIAHLAKLAPDLLIGFQAFKDTLIKLRGFKK